LVTVKRDGKDVPAVAQGTKMGMLYALDRETGKPLFPIEERAVPRSTIKGEQAWPTQPFPTAPSPLVPHGLKPEDLFGATPEELAQCREKFAGLRSEGIFTPPSLEGTILFPGNIGGMNWSSASFDPTRGLLIANTNRLATIVKLIPRDQFSKVAHQNMDKETGPQRGTPYGILRDWLLTSNRVPCNRPPWGALTAVDLSSGKIRWEVPLGTVPGLAKFPDSAKWGSPNLGGSIVTAGGLVFIAAAWDNFLRAFDIETGHEIWKGALPAGGQATPMTYAINGKQYVVIAAGGHGRFGTKQGDYLVAFALE